MPIYMQHPDLDGPPIEAVTEDQARLHEAHGWERVSTVVLAASESAGRPVSALDDLSVAELADFAARNHVDAPAKAKKADLIAAIEAHPDFAPPALATDPDVLADAQPQE